MASRDWPADDYAVGSYIQMTVAESYLKYFQPESGDKVLDIGCGDGSFSTRLLTYIPDGELVGIDSSENMLKLAEAKTKTHPHFSVQKADALNMDFSNTFDYVVSFWCLQWTDNIRKCFLNIHAALKPGGKVLVLFPSGDDPFIKSFQAIKASGQFKELTDYESPMHYDHLQNLEEQLSDLPFKSLQIKREPQYITLPNLDTYRRFVNGIAFYQGKIPPECIPLINEAMVQWYDKYCKENYQGEYRFEFSPWFIRAVK